ncbi:MAG: TonB-dependent receptor [Pseudomonadales bacterium]|nr:TonB-dependent receptor [Pseudomonadales bacterium]
MATLHTVALLSSFFLYSTSLQAEDTPLEFVHITAKRTSDSSVSLSVANIADIPFKQATHINELMNQSPGTWISRGSGQESLTAIRSPVLTGGGSCSAFYMAEDNIPLRAAAFCNVNQLFDVNFEQAKSIEVVRGPGTSFHGNSAVHGIINVLSPDFSSRQHTVLSALYGSHDISRVSIDHREQNWMLQTHVTKDKGYKDNAGFEQQKLRFKALQQDENWTLTHAFDVANLDQNTATYVEGKDAYKDPDRKKENPNPEAFRKAKSLRLSSDFRFQPNADSELIFTPFARINEMEFLMHFLPVPAIEENGHKSLGFQSAFIRPYNEKVQLSSGFDLDISRGYVKQTQEEIGFSDKFPQGEHYNYDVDSRDMAMFIQVDANLSPRWDLSTGIRLQHTSYDYTNNLADGSACVETENDCRYYRPADDTNRFFNWSPHFSLQFEFAPQNYSYLSLSRGYRAPHTSDLYRLESGQILANIDSEEIDAAELGFKGLITSRFVYQLAVFAMQKDNVIVKTNERERVDGQQTQHLGVELAIDYHLFDELLFSASSSYAEHTYASDVQLLNSATEFIKGNFIDTAPKQMHQASLTWMATPASKIQIEVVYMGEYFLDAANTFTYAGHTLSNIRFDQKLPAGFDIQLAVINAANVDYAERADITFARPGKPSEERYFIGEPRNVRLSINKTF